MSQTKRFSSKSRAAEIAAQQKAAQEAQKTYENSLKDALKHAAPARVEFVENLYSYFGIEAESSPRIDKETGEPMRAKDDSIVMVKSDRNEHVRIEKLGKEVGELLYGYDEALVRIASLEREVEVLTSQLETGESGSATREVVPVEDEVEEAGGSEGRDEVPTWS